MRFGPFYASAFWTFLATRHIFTIMAALIIGLSGYLSIHAAFRLTNIVTGVVDLQKRREAVISFVSYLKDAERGQRGFVITGDETYLQPYVVGRSSSVQMFAKLRQLHDGENPWKETLDYVQRDMEAKFNEMDETIHVRREQGMIDAIAIVKTSEGKRLMEDIQNTLMQMNARESNILSMDSFNYRSAMFETVVGYSVTNTMLVGLTLIMFIMIESRKKLLTEQTERKAAFQKQLSKLKQVEKREITGDAAIELIRNVSTNLSDEVAGITSL